MDTKDIQIILSEKYSGIKDIDHFFWELIKGNPDPRLYRDGNPFITYDSLLRNLFLYSQIDWDNSYWNNLDDDKIKCYVRHKLEANKYLQHLITCAYFWNEMDGYRNINDIPDA